MCWQGWTGLPAPGVAEASYAAGWPWGVRAGGIVVRRYEGSTGAATARRDAPWGGPQPAVRDRSRGKDQPKGGAPMCGKRRRKGPHHEAQGGHSFLERSGILLPLAPPTGPSRPQVPPGLWCPGVPIGSVVVSEILDDGQLGIFLRDVPLGILEGSMDQCVALGAEADQVLRIAFAALGALEDVMYLQVFGVAAESAGEALTAIDGLSCGVADVGIHVCRLLSVGPCPRPPGPLGVVQSRVAGGHPEGTAALDGTGVPPLGGIMGAAGGGPVGPADRGGGLPGLVCLGYVVETFQVCLRRFAAQIKAGT